MPDCKVCKQTKPIREMRMWGGTATETCQVCFDLKKAQKQNGGAPPPEPPADPAAPAAAPPSPPRVPRSSPMPSEIVVEASLGFAAKVDGDSLVISQTCGEREDPAAPDNITLTRAEAKRLFDSFGEWIIGAV